MDPMFAIGFICGGAFILAVQWVFRKLFTFLG